MKFKKDVLNYIPSQSKCPLDEDIFPKLREKKQLFAFPSEQRFYDIGLPAGLREMEGVLQ
jgi:NDP-sugar pyrophosphorylase family protein